MIGDALKRKCDEQVEERVHRAVLCAEEVTRREESQRWEQALAAAREEWRQERQQLFHDAHQGQMRAIAKQSAVLEEKLRKEFVETCAQLSDSHEELLQKSIRLAWEEADKIKEDAIQEARKQEQTIARKNAEEHAQTIAKQQRQAKELAERDKKQALDEERVRLNEVHIKAVCDMKIELEQQFAIRMDHMRSDYEAKLNEVQATLEEQIAIKTRLERDLAVMEELRNETERKYEALKTEFSNFIDHVPGFRGEFILK